MAGHPKYQKGLYSHQSGAICAVLAGKDLCLSTSTASGKSLVFMSVAADLLKRERHARVLAFYPVRALIQDQLEKWKAMLDPLGFSVGFIDGSIETKQRSDILLHHRVVLMTPDVAHAWFMSSLGDQRVALVRQNLRLLVLDEAHVYDGVFGTNIAFFLRRLQAVCAPCRLICSTATLGEPNDFIFQLTGRQTVEFGPEQEGANIPSKTVWAARVDGKRGFETSAQLLKTLARQYPGRFLAFADSRKMVELMTAAAHRVDKDATAAVEDALDELADETANRLVPYRAGYENEDRLRIQQALSGGQLQGVVSTSALELGLDIGEVSLVILLTTPPSVKAFWQRIGRAGRRDTGEGLILDTVGTVIGGADGLRGYIKRPIEPNWLYLPNRYIQYTNALCAAQEQQDAGDLYDATHFRDRASWVLGNKVPLKCHGLGGRSSITARVYGDVFDHHSVVYEFENGVRAYAFCRTTTGCYDEDSSIVLGSKGKASIKACRIWGEKNWRWEGKCDPYQVEHDRLFAAIRSGNPLNNGDYMARSTLITVMGQLSCHTGKEITWEQVSQSDFHYPPRPEDCRDDMEAPIHTGSDDTYPVPVPGQTVFKLQSTTTERAKA